MKPNEHIEWTEEFTSLTNNFREHQKGEWVFATEEAKEKYSYLKPEFIYRTIRDEGFSEYAAETEDKYIRIRTFMNYVSIIMAETEYELSKDIDVVGGINDQREISMHEIIYYLNWSSPKEYFEFEFD